MQKPANWFEKMVPDAQDVLRRFPLAVLMMVALTILIMLEVRDFKMSDDIFWKLSGGVVLAGYLSIILTLIGEGRGKTVSPIIKTIVCGAAIVAAYFCRSLNFSWYMVVGAAILFLGSAPFWRQQRDDVAVWDFSHKIWSAVIFTIAGFTLYKSGLFAIELALMSLFELRVHTFFEQWLIPIGGAFLAPIACMAMIPAHDEDDGDTLRNPGFISKAIGFLGTWILAPLTFVYALILLAYIVKIIVGRNLPEGEIGWIITPFLVIGTLTWLVLDPPFIQAKRLARWFHKLWFPLMIPAAILLAVAVFVRVSEYGWTIWRYLLVLTAVWALGIALWYTFRSEAKRDIRIIPGFAAFLLVLGSIGPWGADSVSTRSQLHRLKQALVANDSLLSTGKLKPVTELAFVDNDVTRRARGALEYLVKYKKTKQINAFAQENLSHGIYSHDFGVRYEARDKIYKRFALNDIDVDIQFYTKIVSPNSSYTYIKEGPIDMRVSGYDYYLAKYNFTFAATEYLSFELGEYSVSLDNRDVVVKLANSEVSRFKLMDWITEQKADETGNLELDPRLLIYDNGTQKIAFHITGIFIYPGKDNRLLGPVDFAVLVKNIDVEKP